MCNEYKCLSTSERKYKYEMHDHKSFPCWTLQQITSRVENVLKLHFYNKNFEVNTLLQYSYKNFTLRCNQKFENYVELKDLHQAKVGTTLDITDHI